MTRSDDRPLLAARGEVWLADLAPVRGHEQGSARPVLIVSTNRFNSGPAHLVVIVPLTSRDRGIPLHVSIDPPEAGIKVRSFAMCAAIRSLSTERLVRSWGSVSPATLALVEDGVRILLEL
jgi:mRNA interferase MazF